VKSPTSPTPGYPPSSALCGLTILLPTPFNPAPQEIGFLACDSNGRSAGNALVPLLFIDRSGSCSLVMARPEGSVNQSRPTRGTASLSFSAAPEVVKIVAARVMSRCCRHRPPL
jgi:hypothetical protein